MSVTWYEFQTSIQLGTTLDNYYLKESSVGCSSCPTTASVIMVPTHQVGAVLFIQNVLFSSSSFPLQTSITFATLLLCRLSAGMPSDYRFQCGHVSIRHAMQLYIFLNSLPLSLTQILNGI